jgi:hypothetical protein
MLPSLTEDNKMNKAESTIQVLSANISSPLLLKEK